MKSLKERLEEITSPGCDNAPDGLSYGIVIDAAGARCILDLLVAAEKPIAAYDRAHGVAGVASWKGVDVDELRFAIKTMKE